MSKGRIVYQVVIHGFAAVGVFLLFSLSTGITRFSISLARVRTNAVLASAQLPVVPGGASRATWRIEEIVVDNRVIGRIWYSDGKLCEMEFSPTGAQTKWSTHLSNAFSSKSISRWVGSVDSYHDGDDPWSDFPVLTVHDSTGLGVPDVAVVWQGTTPKRTLKGIDIWNEIVGDVNPQDLVEERESEEGPDQ